MLGYFLVLLLVSLAPSCGTDEELPSLNQTKDGACSPDSTPKHSNQYSKIIPSTEDNYAIKERLLKDFRKPLLSYPLIKSTSVNYGKDGLLYRKGIDTPFSGRLVDLSETGVALLEVSFLDGQPHGQQLRKNENGVVLMEAFFSHGSLTGIKTKWWPSGSIKEEEYWDNGSYRGRRLWDEDGRLIKEEQVKQM